MASPECLKSDAACALVAKACQKSGPRLHHCLPLQKRQMEQCGAVYSKAYGSCWHAYDSASSRGSTVASPNALETEIVVRRCGMAFAKSTLLCQHRSSFFQREASLHPEKAVLMQVKRAKACRAVHRKGQSSCRQAWKDTGATGLSRDATARQHLNGAASPVFWPNFVSTVLHGKEPTMASQMQAKPSHSDTMAVRSILKMAADIKRQAGNPPATDLLAVRETSQHKMAAAVMPSHYNPHAETHPLTVAMDECRKLQTIAAHACLNADATQCHKAFGTAYVSCFDRFQLARTMLVRAKRMPEQLTRKEAERKAIRAQLAAEAAVPPELQEEARVACARAYTAYSVKCQAAHSHAGSLCRKFATRREVDPDPSTLDRCGSTQSQTKTVCDQELARGRQDCEKAWFKVKAMAQGKDIKPPAVMNPNVPGYENNRQYTEEPPLTEMLATLNGHDGPAVTSMQAQLHEAEATVLHKRLVSQQLLREAQATGIKSEKQRKKAAGALLELFALEGVAQSLNAMITDEKVTHSSDVLVVPPLSKATATTVEETRELPAVDALGIPQLPISSDIADLVRATKAIQTKVDSFSGPAAKVLVNAGDA